jgi:predicted ester cyclase
MRSPRMTRRHFSFGLSLAFVCGLATQLLAGAESPPAMSVDQTQTTMQAFAAVEQGSGNYGSIFADDVVVTFVGTGQELNGSAAVKSAIDGLQAERFDARTTIKNLVVGPGQAALGAEFVTTRTGEFPGSAPAERQVIVPYSIFFELRDGKITAMRIYGLADGFGQPGPASQNGHKGVGPIPPN